MPIEARTRAPARPLPAPAPPLTIAISSRALFDLEASHRIFVEQGLAAYARYQIAHEDELLQPGVAFALVEKLLRLNDAEHRRVNVILLSHNSADTGLRIFRAIEHYGLDITQAAFTNGRSPYHYVSPFGADLFLSADPGDVARALAEDMAAATIIPKRVTPAAGAQLRIAFDGDAVLFSDEAERVFREQGIEAFGESERRAAREPLAGGPFKNFLAALHRIQSDYPIEGSPIRTALVTARSAPAHERAIRTLREWNIRIDEALFLGGLDKAPFLKTFGADIFFDDQRAHCEVASDLVATGHVPHGIANE
ncbi:MAG TPA: 5'-nucleotidase [Gammaproteobacteria bacterium]|nr:5'-nucleotidase [Gammaproteobacteria bacterium]